MIKQYILFIITALIAFTACFGLLYILFKPSVEENLIDVNSTSSYAAPIIPTSFDPIKEPLDELLRDSNYHIISTNRTSTGIIFVLGSDRKTLVCLLTLPNINKNQYDATSRCWRISKKYRWE